VRLGIVLTDEIKASSHYLWISLVIGCLLPSWMYMESGLHGRWLVVVGMPLSAVCGAFVCRDREKVNRPSLQDPLLPGEPDAVAALGTI